MTTARHQIMQTTADLKSLTHSIPTQIGARHDVTRLTPNELN